MKITFDKTNPNRLLFHDEKGKLIYFLALPPTSKGCDIIRMGDDRDSGYIFDFAGLILITNKRTRKLYHKGELIAETSRKFSPLFNFLKL